MYAGDAGGCEYTENLNIPVRAGLDHVEALAILVTELAHFESGARRAIAAGIIEDAVPEGAGYSGAVPAGESPD